MCGSGEGMRERAGFRRNCLGHHPAPYTKPYSLFPLPSPITLPTYLQSRSSFRASPLVPYTLPPNAHLTSFSLPTHPRLHPFTLPGRFLAHALLTS